MKLISCEKLEKSMVELQFSIDAETFKSARTPPPPSWATLPRPPARFWKGRG